MEKLAIVKGIQQGNTFVDPNVQSLTKDDIRFIQDDNLDPIVVTGYHAGDVIPAGNYYFGLFDTESGKFVGQLTRIEEMTIQYPSDYKPKAKLETTNSGFKLTRDKDAE